MNFCCERSDFVGQQRRKDLPAPSIDAPAEFVAYIGNTCGGIQPRRDYWPENRQLLQLLIVGFTLA